MGLWPLIVSGRILGQEADMIMIIFGQNPGDADLLKWISNNGDLGVAAALIVALVVILRYQGRQLRLIERLATKNGDDRDKNPPPETRDN